MKRVLFLLVGLAVSAVSLYYALKDFEWSGLGEAVGKVQWVFLLLMLVPYVLTFMTKVWRWKVLFHPDERRVSTGLLFSGLMLSYIPLPFRAGEVARGVVVSARSGLPAARVFSTILVEKVLDILTLLLLLGISLPFVGLPKAMQGNATALGTIFLIVALAILAVVLKPNLARAIAGAVTSRLPERLGGRLYAAVDQALQGMAPLAEAATAGKLVLWSLATWSVNALTVYLMLLAFNLAVTPMAAVTLIVATNLGMAVPSAPGYVGTFELVVSTVLGILGITADQAKSFAILYHFIGLVPVAAIGVGVAIAQGVGMSAFSNASSQNAPPVVAGAAATRDKR